MVGHFPSVQRASNLISSNEKKKKRRNMKVDFWDKQSSVGSARGLVSLGFPPGLGAGMKTQKPGEQAPVLPTVLLALSPPT